MQVVNSLRMNNTQTSSTLKQICTHAQVYARWKDKDEVRGHTLDMKGSVEWWEVLCTKGEDAANDCVCAQTKALVEVFREEIENASSKS